jgi:hypothetical protein
LSSRAAETRGVGFGPPPKAGLATGLNADR